LYRRGGFFVHRAVFFVQNRGISAPEKVPKTTGNALLARVALNCTKRLCFLTVFEGVLLRGVPAV